jgi:hypothetical protein
MVAIELFGSVPAFATTSIENQKYFRAERQEAEKG